MKKFATYQIEAWKKGGLVFRTEESDSLEMTKQNAQTLYDDLGVMYTVFIVRDGVQFLNCEWAGLAA